ncbi:MAG: flagellar basal body L-ring protein FlgH [Caulobacteraceae bacterium]|nr:flagellar basal body L-ring protein FlgH [Caulobacteraceae bacterium]
MRRLMFVLIAATPLAACGSVREAVNGPGPLSPIAYPAALVPTAQAVLPVSASSREPLPQSASANSLWRTGAREFLADQRANRVGDILTVLINIDDSAKTTNATNATKTSANTVGIPNFLGLESSLGRVLPKAFVPSTAIATNTSLAAAGSGGITRQEQITLTIAAVVTQVLPNGNLVIQGRQEVKTNNDTRILTVAGIVRPEDITATNTILHTQIAEARIDYGGKGDIAAVQKTPGGTALLQRFTPF